MPRLEDYQQFEGLHWETGSLRNYYDYRGVKAPHTGRPFSEALFMGVSGGAVMGYFPFAYKGYDPMAHILTRNTFDPFDRILERLGVMQNIVQTSQAERGLANLIDTLAAGIPAIVWADMFSLPYNLLPQDPGMWGMFPLVVYGHDEAADEISIADRARVGLTVTPAELAAARGRVKKLKFRLMAPEPPNAAKLATAVAQGIGDCIALYTEKPPKGAKHNFGLAAYQHWADLLTRPGLRGSWAKEFPAGSKLYAGLTSAFTDINIFGKDGQAERPLYAAFLEEACVLLERPGLAEAAALFRDSGRAWSRLSAALLPDEVAGLRETRELMLRGHALFLEQGNGSIGERETINGRLAEIKAELAADFPLDEAGVERLRAEIAGRVLAIRDIEQEAVRALQAAMG